MQSTSTPKQRSTTAMQKDRTEDEGRRATSHDGRSSMLHMAEELIPKFSGQDSAYPVTKWIQEIEENGEIFEWSETQKLLVARRSLSGTAALWLRSEKTYKSWSELQIAIDREFQDSIDQKQVHEMMSARKKLRNESCIDYLFTMKQLGKRGKMPDYVAIKYIIDGIQDAEINKIMFYGVTTYHDLKEKIKIYEAFKKNTMETRGKTNSSFKHTRSTTTASTARCYNCGEKNHVSEECPHRAVGMKCFRCNEFAGHISSNCPLKVKKMAPATNLSFSKAATVAPPAASCAPSSSFFRMPSETSGSNRSKTHQKPANQTEKQVFFNTTQDGATNNMDDVQGDVYLATTTTTTDVNIASGILGNAKTHEDELGTLRSNKMAAHFKNVKSVKTDVQKVNKQDYELFRREKPLKTVNLCDKSVSALVDSGCDVCLMSSDLFNELGEVKCDINSKITLTGLGYTKVQSFAAVTLNIAIDNHEYVGVTFYVVPRDSMPFKLILGNDFLRDVTVCMKGCSVWIAPKDDDWMSVMMCNYDVKGDFPDVDHIKDINVKQEVQQLVSSYHPQQTKEAPIQMKIIVKDDIPVKFNPRRISLREQAEVEQQVNEWLENGIVRVSYSDYASPVVLVRKKDGSLRVCIDFRKLNEKIVKDEYPIPLIEDYIDKLCDAKVYSLLDLKDGFFHLKISEESIKYTGFVTHHGQFEFLKAPFGLSICPNYFMRFITIIFRELMAKGWILIFIDDILIPAKTESEALERLKEVLRVASEYGLKINWKKANLVTRSITFLGHKIENGEVRPSTEKLDAVMKFPEPRSTKQVRSFVGLASYFRKYIMNFAMIAGPLTDLLKKDAPFVFRDRERQAFHILKQKLTSSPVLKIFNPRLQTELHTDASSSAIAAILIQRDENNDTHPTYYMSRKTNKCEEKYSSYELEAMAVIEGVKKFRCYLFGIKFKIITDCKAFEMTLKKKDLTPKVARWAMFLQEFDFILEHRSGSMMRHVDALSRNPYVGVVTTIHENLKNAQENDEGLKAIATILKEKPYADYYLDNGLLYKGNEKLLVVPKSMELAIIERAHSNGHFSVKKTTEAISKNYFIKNIDKKVQEYISACIPCLLAINKSGKKEGFLHVIDKGEVPLHTIHLDHIGPMSETKKQYNYILTVIDGFTKFVWLFPTKGLTAKEVVDKIKIHQQTFSNPTRFITDRGSAFTSQEFEDYCKEQSIEHIKITTGVPRANGQVERIHRTLIAVLTKMCIEEPSLWYRHVGSVQRALNSTYQRSIGTTPFELLLGVRMKTKDKEIYDLIRQEEILEFSENREQLRMKAKEQILKVQEENIEEL